MGNWLRRAHPAEAGFGCLRQHGLFSHDEKHLASKISNTYQIFGTVTTPAAGTKSIGLPANSRAVMPAPTVASGVFAMPL
jgi:hypothetical protein